MNLIKFRGLPFYFFSLSLGLFIGFFLILALRHGWFATHQKMVVSFDRGDGLLPGTKVLIRGLKAGQVTEVEMDEYGKILVTLKLQGKFAKLLKEDAQVLAYRPFVIGERVLSIDPGKESLALNFAEKLNGVVAPEITDMVNNPSFHLALENFDALMKDLSQLVSKDRNDENKNGTFVSLFSQGMKSLKALESMSRDVTVLRKDFFMDPKTLALITKLNQTTEQLNHVMIETEKAMPGLKETGQEVALILPDLKKALSEAVVTLQAMQRSFLFRGGVESLKAEQDERKPPENRIPANAE